MNRIRTMATAMTVGVLSIAMCTCLVARSGAEVRARNLLAAAGEDPDEQPERPVVIVAARNGTFSGKVAVSNASTLAAQASDLKSGAAVIPAENVLLRYSVPWPADFGRRMPRRADILLEAPPAEAPGEVEVWITVKVPKDAKAGVYQGTVRVAGAEVPLEVKVQDWTLPDTPDYRTWVDMIQSPDTLALEYKVPLWSEKHWQLIARSLRLMGQSGNKTLYIPLICHTNSGNEESMVRWIRKGEDKYEYDFSIVDRYLDLALENMGRPTMVIFQAWEVYLKPPGQEVVINEGDSDYVKMEKQKAAARWQLRDRGPAVTMIEGGKAATDYLPKYTDPRSRSLWQPVWDELHKRMAKRSLEGTMVLGMLSDSRPGREEGQFLSDVSGGLPWASEAHGGVTYGRRSNLGFGTVAYDCNVWDFQWVVDPSKTRMYGWKEPSVVAVYHRFQFCNQATWTALRNDMEQNITGKQRGVGRIGADTWPALANKRGERAGSVADRYPQSYWHSLNIGSWMLAPGPEGPVSTARYEHFREGVQECEARIGIEQALTDPALKSRLPGDLAERAQALLDERQRDVWKGLGLYDAVMESQQDGVVNGMRAYTGLGALKDRRKYQSVAGHYWTVDGHKWFVTSGWQDRTEKLFALAGEVTRALGAK